ncbi:MAG: diguanylate cyclase [Sulfuricurvum sp.]
MANPSILIVDDEPLNLRISAESLKDHYQLFVARSGEEALEFFNDNMADIILLDINMPGLNGFEVAQRLRKMEKTCHIPIIYLTAENSAQTITQAFKNGAADYVSKPFREEELLARIQNRLETENLKKEFRKTLETNEHLLNIVNQYVSYVKTDINGIITEASPSFCDEIHGIGKELVGENICILKSGHTPQEVYKALWETIESGRTFINEIENRNLDGETSWYRTTITPDFKEGVIVGYIAFYQNIDEKMRYKHDAQVDYLTGLYNRLKFEEAINEEIIRTQRYDLPLSVIMVDIDHFKVVNDVCGHDTGDIVLKEFAALLKQTLRNTDILARWGGEEFIILCTHTDVVGAATLAENLRTTVEAYPFPIIGHKTASFGVAGYHDALDAKKLFLEVDQALYTAKERGRNQVVVVN